MGQAITKILEDQFELKIDTKNDKNKKFLIPTAEVVLTNLVRDSVVNKDDLPKDCGIHTLF